MTTKRKAVQSFRLKDAATGEIEVVFATLNVVDLDGDVLTKEAFTDGAPVIISAYGHRSHIGDLPIGKGKLVITDDEAKAEAHLFLDTTHGRDAFLTIKALEDLQEWSFALRDVEAHSEKRGTQSVNVITKVSVPEVSPVLEGAGINTRTLVAKAWKQSASQLERNLRSAGQERFADDETYVWVEDWDVDKSSVVFAVMPNDAPEKLVQVTFERDGNTVTLSDEETEVSRVVEYVPKSHGEPEARKFAEHVKTVLSELTKLTDRAREVVSFRAAKGSPRLSEDAATVVADLEAEFDKLRELVAGEPAASPDLSPESVLIHADLMEVIES